MANRGKSRRSWAATTTFSQEHTEYTEKQKFHIDTQDEQELVLEEK